MASVGDGDRRIIGGNRRPTLGTTDCRDVSKTHAMAGFDPELLGSAKEIAALCCGCGIGNPGKADVPAVKLASSAWHCRQG